MPVNKSLLAFFFCTFFLLSASLYEQKIQNWGRNTEISWDASGYYLYLPSFFYDDLGELRNRQYLIDNYHPSGDDISAHRAPSGKFIMKYSSGMAFMYLPGFAVGHIWAKLSGARVDGFSPPYEVSMAFYSTLICCLGLWFIRKALLFYFEDVLVALALLILCWATNYLQYSSANGMLTHGYLFTIYSLILYHTIKWYRQPVLKRAVYLGLLAGLAALTRPTEVICVFIPLAWGVGSFKDIQDRIKLLLREWPQLPVFLCCAIAVGSVQLVYWKVMSGHLLYWSYDDPNDGFNFLRVPVHACLFSYKKGWWVYTPLMLLTLPGFLFLFLRRKGIFWPSFIFSVVALYVVFSWKNWAYGGSFSQRAVVQYYALLIFPVVAVFEWVKTKPYLKFVTIVFCLFCTYINLVMTWQADVSNVMESDNMTKQYYWAIFGRPYVSPDTKKLIYTDEVIPDRLIPSLRVIFSTDTIAEKENYRDTISEGKRLYILDKDQHHIPTASADVGGKTKGWFRIKTSLAVKQWEGNPWKQPYMYAALVNEDGNQIKFKSFPVQRILRSDSLQDIFIDIQIPEGEKIKFVKGGLNNNDNDKLVFGGPVIVQYSECN